MYKLTIKELINFKVSKYKLTIRDLIKLKIHLFSEMLSERGMMLVEKKILPIVAI